MRHQHYLIAIFVAMLGVIAAFLLATTSLIAQDLEIYRQAGVFLRSGRNPYQLPVLTEYISLLGTGCSDWRALQIWTPPFSLFFPLLISIFSSSAATILWVLVYIAAVTCGLQSWDIIKGSRLSPYVKTAVFVGFLPIIEHGIMWGSVAPFEMLPFFIFVFLLVRKRGASNLAAACLFLMTFKPQLVAAPLCVYALRVLTRQAPARSAWLASGLMFASLSLSVSLRPSILNDYVHLDRSLFFDHARFTVSLPTIFGAQPWQSLSAYGVVTAVSLSLFFIFYQYIRHLPLGQQLVEISPWTFLLIPYCWAHDYLIILPWVIIVVHSGTLERDPVRRILFAMGTFFWMGGDWFLGNDLCLGHLTARYFFNFAILAWILQRTLQAKSAYKETVAA